MPNLNPPPLIVPREFQSSREANDYFNAINTYLRQLAALLGSGSSIILTPQASHRVLIGPASGANAVATFRRLQASDLPTLSGDSVGLGVGDTPTFAGLKLTNLAAKAFLYSSTAEHIVSTTPADDGELLIGWTDNAPVKAALTDVALQTMITNGPGSITIGLVQDIDTTSTPEFVTVLLSALIAGGYLFTAADNTIMSTAAATDGQLLIGATGADPALAEITSSSGQLAITNGPNTIDLTLEDELLVAHLIGSTAAPAIAAGAGAGTAPTIAITGTDLGFRITLTTGTLPTGLNAVIATATFNTAFAAAPFAVFSPRNAATAALSGATMLFGTTTMNTFVLTSGTTALTAATQYIWDVIVVG